MIPPPYMREEAVAMSEIVMFTQALAVLMLIALLFALLKK